ncbi:MAG: coproporphyrinogen III oxidase-like Fe-S oxidoreductase, partial [Planctomycetota bacterium]
YELSNFAPKDHQCTHNKHYWANGPYVGLGPSAVSYIDGTRFGNPRSIGAWRAAVDGGHLAANWEETLSPLESLGESWWLGLRTSHGVDPVQARTNAAGAGVDLPAGPDPCVATAGELVAGGWLERCGKGGERTRIPEQHLAVADELSRRFLTLTQPR